MTELKNYLQDGANHQARAVLAFLQQPDGIEESWNADFKCYDAKPKVSRWENCREQGYVVSLVAKNRKQLNIAFFEHRNSDTICAIKWEQYSINSLTIDNAKFDGIYKGKYDVSHKEPYGNVFQMSDWIWKELENFWGSNL